MSLFIDFDFDLFKKSLNQARYRLSYKEKIIRMWWKNNKDIEERRKIIKRILNRIETLEKIK